MANLASATRHLPFPECGSVPIRHAPLPPAGPAPKMRILSRDFSGNMKTLLGLRRLIPRVSCPNAEEHRTLRRCAL
jgi:hypothetical protein